MNFIYSDTNKRYHTLDYYYKNIFKTKIIKISLNAGFSCPHLKSGGCIYCSDSGSGEYAGNVNDNLITQFNKGKELISEMMKLNPKLNVITSVKKYIDSEANKNLKEMLEKDILATNIYTLGYYADSYSNLDYTNKIEII